MPSKPLSTAGSDLGQSKKGHDWKADLGDAGSSSLSEKLGEWKADFDDKGSHAAKSTASRPSQAMKKSKAGTSKTSDSEVCMRYLILGRLSQNI